MESNPGQPGEDAYEALIEEAVSGSGDGFSDDSESLSQPQAPDVGEALQQLDQRFAAIEDRLDAEPDDQGYDEDDFDPDEFQYNPAIGQPEDDQNDVLRQLLSEEVAEQVQPYVDAVENSFREQQILQLAERYPALREPETLDAVSGKLEQFAQAYNLPGGTHRPSADRAVSSRTSGATGSRGGAGTVSGRCPPRDRRRPR